PSTAACSSSNASDSTSVPTGWAARSSPRRAVATATSSASCSPCNARTTKPVDRSIGKSNRPPSSYAHDTWRALMPDPLDKQLVEAVLTRPRRAKADVEEAKLATRGLRAAKVVLPAVEDDEDDDDAIEIAAPEGLADAGGGDVGREVVGADGAAGESKLPPD